LIFQFYYLFLEQVINRQGDEDRGEQNREAEYLLLDAPLGRISAAALAERRTQTRAAALLEQDQSDKND